MSENVGSASGPQSAAAEVAHPSDLGATQDESKTQDEALVEKSSSPATGSVVPQPTETSSDAGAMAAAGMGNPNSDIVESAAIAEKAIPAAGSQQTESAQPEGGREPSIPLNSVDAQGLQGLLSLTQQALQHAPALQTIVSGAEVKVAVPSEQLKEVAEPPVAQSNDTPHSSREETAGIAQESPAPIVETPLPTAVQSQQTEPNTEAGTEEQTSQPKFHAESVNETQQELIPSPATQSVGAVNTSEAQAQTQVQVQVQAPAVDVSNNTLETGLSVQELDVVPQRKAQSSEHVEAIDNDDDVTGEIQETLDAGADGSVPFGEDPRLKKGSEQVELSEIPSGSGHEPPPPPPATIDRRGDRMNQDRGGRQRHPPNSRVFIGNLASENLTKQEVVDVFEKYGRLVEEPVMRRSFGFVQYSSQAPAAEAIRCEQGKILGGRRIDLSFADNRDPRRTNEGGRHGRRDDDRDGRGREDRHRRDGGYDNDRRKRRRSVSPRSRGFGNESGRKRRPDPVNGIKVRILVMGSHARDYASQCDYIIRSLLMLSTDFEQIDSSKLGESLRRSRDQNVPYVIVVSSRDEEKKTCTIRTLEATGYEKAKSEKGVIGFREALDVLVADEGRNPLPPDFTIQWSALSDAASLGMNRGNVAQQGRADEGYGQPRGLSGMPGGLPPSGLPQQLGGFAPPMGVYDGIGAQPNVPPVGRGGDPRTRFDRGSNAPPMNVMGGGADVGGGSTPGQPGGIDLKLFSQLSQGGMLPPQQMMQQSQQQPSLPQGPLPGGSDGSQLNGGTQGAGAPQQLDLSKITNLLSTFTQLQQMQQQQTPAQPSSTGAQLPQNATQQLLASLGRFGGPGGAAGSQPVSQPQQAPPSQGPQSQQQQQQPGLNLLQLLQQQQLQQQQHQPPQYRR